MRNLNKFINSKKFDYSCTAIFFFSGIINLILNINITNNLFIMNLKIILISTIYFLLSFLFLIREKPRDITTLRESIIPIISIITPILIINISSLFDAQYTFIYIGTYIIIMGLLINFLSFYNLKKSFSILPTRRRIITSGLYSKIRHPAYLGEIIMGIGLIVTHLNYMGIMILICGISATIFRIKIEEKKLSVDKKYLNYRLKVKYKLVPRIW